MNYILGSAAVTWLGLPKITWIKTSKVSHRFCGSVSGMKMSGKARKELSTSVPHPCKLSAPYRSARFPLTTVRPTTRPSSDFNFCPSITGEEQVQTPGQASFNLQCQVLAPWANYLAILEQRMAQLRRESSFMSLLCPWLIAQWAGDCKELVFCWINGSY